MSIGSPASGNGPVSTVGSTVVVVDRGRGGGRRGLGGDRGGPRRRLGAGGRLGERRRRRGHQRGLVVAGDPGEDGEPAGDQGGDHPDDEQPLSGAAAARAGATGVGTVEMHRFVVDGVNRCAPPATARPVASVAHPTPYRRLRPGWTAAARSTWQRRQDRQCSPPLRQFRSPLLRIPPAPHRGHPRRRVGSRSRSVGLARIRWPARWDRPPAGRHLPPTRLQPQARRPRSCAVVGGSVVVVVWRVRAGVGPGDATPRRRWPPALRRGSGLGISLVGHDFGVGDARPRFGRPGLPGAALHRTAAPATLRSAPAPRLPRWWPKRRA